jgi:hypothetical protein
MAAYNQYHWAALMVLDPKLALDLTPERAVPAIPCIAEHALEWLRGAPLLPEEEGSRVVSPALLAGLVSSDLALIEAAHTRVRTDGTRFSLRAVAIQLGLVDTLISGKTQTPVFSRATPPQGAPSYNLGLVMQELLRRWETRPGAPDTGGAGPWLLSEVCQAAGCARPLVVQRAVHALGAAIGDHHVLRSRSVADVTPISQGGSERLDPVDAQLWIIDVAFDTPELRRELGLDLG